MTKRKKVGWKVLDKKTRGSCFVPWFIRYLEGYKDDERPPPLVYPARRVVRPLPGWGPLTVFKTRVAAREWVHVIMCNHLICDDLGCVFGDSVIIVKCLYVSAPKKDRFLQCPVGNSLLTYRRASIWELPKGTKLAASVTCLD